MRVTVVVPAHDEAEVLGDTLQALLEQTRLPERIIVVDDASSDGTGDVARLFGVDVLRLETGEGGSKARAQNAALREVDTELVLPVDADTLLARDYVELIVEPFADPRVVVAAGCVQTRFTDTVWERGREIEYLFGFHWHRPIQNRAGAPMVCSGCCSCFVTEELRAFGGFPERTIVEDMDYTWSRQIDGMRAVYVPDAVAWAADPRELEYLRKQVWRWMAGFFQNVRIHFWELLRFKKMLALWVGLAVVEVATAPLWYLFPVIGPALWGWHVRDAVGWWVGSEVVLTLPPLVYGARKRGLSVWRVLSHFPAVYANRGVNIYYAWKALVVELLLVPLGLSRGLTVYEKGRA